MSSKAFHRVFVETDVFAALWRERRPGEETENDILRRIYKLDGAADSTEEVVAIPSQKRPRGARAAPCAVEPVAASGAVIHSEAGRDFVGGFEIFRGDKGQEYRAQVVGRGWRLQTGEVYPSIEALNHGIGAHDPNPWMIWIYRDRNKRRRPVDDYPQGL